MSNDQDAIEAVLGGFVPIGDDHPRAAETYDAVKAMLEARTDETAELVSVDDSRILRPGDTVIFATDRTLDAAQAEALKAQIVADMPGIIPVIFDGLRIEGVYRNEH